MFDVIVNSKMTPYELFLNLKNIRRSKSGWIKISKRVQKLLKINASCVYGIKTTYAEDDIRYHLFTVQAKNDTITVRCYTIDDNPYFGLKLVVLHVWEYKY